MKSICTALFALLAVAPFADAGHNGVGRSFNTGRNFSYNRSNVIAFGLGYGYATPVIVAQPPLAVAVYVPQASPVLAAPYANGVGYGGGLVAPQYVPAYGTAGYTSVYGTGYGVGGGFGITNGYGYNGVNGVNRGVAFNGNTATGTATTPAALTPAQIAARAAIAADKTALRTDIAAVRADKTALAAAQAANAATPNAANAAAVAAAQTQLATDRAAAQAARSTLNAARSAAGFRRR